MKLLIILMIFLTGIRNSFAQEVIIPFRNFSKWYFVDSRGNRIGECTYQKAFSYSGELAAVQLDGKYGFVNRKDSIIIPCIYDFAKCEFGSLQVSLDHDTFYIDLEGNKIDPSKYCYNTGGYRNSLNRIFKENGKYGMEIWPTHKLILPLYDSINIVIHSEAIMVWKNHKIGVFDNLGEQIIPFELDSFKLDHISHPNLIWIYRRGKIGALNLLGEIMAYPKYQNLKYENELVYTILKNGKKGYIYEGEEYWRNFLWW
jgi:hypothetical protein